MTVSSEEAILDPQQEKQFCGGNKMFSNLDLRWHKTFEVYEFISKPLIWIIFPEQSAGINPPLKRPSCLTSSSALWKLPKTQPAPPHCCSSQWGLLTQPDADPSWKPFDHINAHSSDALDSLACCLIHLLGKTLLLEGVVWSPAVIWNGEIHTHLARCVVAGSPWLYVFSLNLVTVTYKRYRPYTVHANTNGENCSKKVITNKMMNLNEPLVGATQL